MSIKFIRLPWVVLLLCSLASLALEPRTHGEWQDVKIPEAWKTPRRGMSGYAWYRCRLKVPAAWRERTLELFLEPVDDAREWYLNGVKLGTVGSFPPQFRSGLGGNDRHAIDPAHVRFGEDNLLAIRVYDNDGRGGFNVAAPVLFGGSEALRLQGTWQFQTGDDVAWSQWDDEQLPAAATTIATLVPKAEAERTLRQLPGEVGPLPPDEALTHFQTPDDLQVDLVLSEPQIGQPLFMSFDERGRLWVVNYLQYPNPAGLTAVSRDKFLRSVYDKVPAPPPHHVRGADRITIHEDTDGDGRFDKHKVFVDGLNMASSFARGLGGVWVLNPPYLLFYPDRNGDDVPDGDPEVHLEGFGLEDSHSIANNLRFGPDGWLYAAQGSTVSGNVRRYGSQDKPVHSMGQLIWRYHPDTRRYEIFAEGGGNTFGVEIDSKGRVYSGHNGGDTRGFHYIQGGYYQKGFGKHGDLSNPYAFGYFPPMKHNQVPRFTHTFIVYEGAALSARYAGKLFGVGPLQSHVIMSDVQPSGTSFVTQDIGLALSTDDTWFRPVAIAPGPEGALYVADFYEQRIDHASHYQGRVDKESGRIYRLRAKDAQSAERFDYARLTSDQLIDRLTSENRWQREAIQRTLGDRRDATVLPRLTRLVESAQGQLALEALWALHLAGGFTDAVAAATINHSDPYVRLWSVRLICDRPQVAPQLAQLLVERARTEPQAEVRCQLACSARRLPAAQALPLVDQLMRRAEDKEDPFIPLSLWWVLEAKAGSDRAAVLRLFDDLSLWQAPLVQNHLLERLMRRFAQAGTQADLIACAHLLTTAPSPDHVRTLMQGFETAYSGRELTGLPPELAAAMAQVGGGSLALRLRRSDPAAVAESLKIVANEKAKEADRLRYIQVFGQVPQPASVAVLLEVTASTGNETVRAAAISALQSYDDPGIPTAILSRQASWPESTREVAISVLASRKAWAAKLLAAVEAGDVARETIPVAALHRILFHRDPALTAIVNQHWGELKDASSEEMQQHVERYSQVLATGVGNPYRGKRLFVENCGKCHVLFGSGGQIGPDLTAYKRDDVRGILMNVVNPSLEIREGFENYLVMTADGRTLNGFIIEQDNRMVSLKQADGQAVVIPRTEIEDMAPIKRSVMPEGLLKDYSEEQLRDLFAFLRTTQPLPD